MLEWCLLRVRASLNWSAGMVAMTIPYHSCGGSNSSVSSFFPSDVPHFTLAFYSYIPRSACSVHSTWTAASIFIVERIPAVLFPVRHHLSPAFLCFPLQYGNHRNVLCILLWLEWERSCEMFNLFRLPVLLEATFGYQGFATVVRRAPGAPTVPESRRIQVLPVSV